MFDLSGKVAVAGIIHKYVNGSECRDRKFYQCLKVGVDQYVACRSGSRPAESADAFGHSTRLIGVDVAYNNTSSM